MKTSRLLTVALVASVTLAPVLPAADAPAPASQPATQPSPQALKDVNVRFMVRGYCFAKSSVKDDKAPGGFGSSDNAAKPIAANLPVVKGRLQLVADPAAVVAFGEHRGLMLALANTTDKPVWLAASDSRLSIVQEAKDADGTWKPIEYLPSSWCGNSYHRVCLRRGECWTFTAPRYAGDLPTKLRFRLDQRDQPPIYSNEFEGSVNPEQFTRKQGHQPTNIMDPYLD
jgi:hypothetical protein